MATKAQRKGIDETINLVSDQVREIDKRFIGILEQVSIVRLLFIQPLFLWLK